MSQAPGFCPDPEGEEVKKMEVNTNTKKRGPYLPRELRIKLYNDVRKLRKQGLSYTKNQKQDLPKIRSLDRQVDDMELVTQSVQSIQREIYPIAETTETF